MSRPIKFRVWSGNMWYDGSDALRYLCAKNPDSTDIELTYLKEDYIINLSTGLKDKNGREIYEGDIVKSIVKTRWTDYLIYTVEWKPELCRHIIIEPDGMNGFYGLEESYTDEDIAKHPPENQYLEIIGNIYENPELLAPKRAGRGK